MFRLVIKDLLPLFKNRSAIFFLVLPALGGFVSITNLSTAAMFIFFATYYPVVYASAYDYKYKQERFFLSLPISRGEWVVSRYLLVFVSILISLVVFLASNLACRLGGLGATAPSAIFIISLVISPCLYYGLYLPVYFIFGYLKARWVMMGLMMLSAVAFYALPRVVELRTGGAEASAWALQIGWAYLALALLAGLGITAISAFISVKAVKNKEF